MYRIMFVCHGNICRSPMAEFIFKDLVKKRKLDDEFFVASCATSSEEIWGNVGNPVYPPVKAELLKHGITCEGKRAVQLKRDDYENYDLFVGMDRNNIRNMHMIFSGDPKGKIHKLLEFAASPADVNDPWYTDRFDVAFRDIYRGCVALLDKLMPKNDVNN